MRVAEPKCTIIDVLMHSQMYEIRWILASFDDYSQNPTLDDSFKPKLLGQDVFCSTTCLFESGLMFGKPKAQVASLFLGISKDCTLAKSLAYWSLFQNEV